MSEPVVQATGLTKVFRDFWHRDKVRAVDSLDLELMPGEVFGLLGPNGSGKSTTVKLILGLLFPTRGMVTVFGRSSRCVEVKRRIGFLPEETYLYPYLSAEETLDFYGRVFEIPRAERRRRIEALIRMVGLTGASKRRLGEYSKGMARRIGLAQALIGDPDLVLLDEPTTGLDPIGTAEVKELIAELKRRGKTVLLCSHLLADVEDVCDRIAILYGGRLRDVGRVDDLLSQRSVTQITASDLSPETVDAVAKLISQQPGAKDVEIGHPMDRLERFFLRVVAKAHAEQPTTAGAQFGDIKADIYGQAVAPASDGQGVVERLMQADERPHGPAPTEPRGQDRPRDQAAKGGVIERLQEAADSLPAAPLPPTTTEREGKAEEAKRVLDRLMRGNDAAGEADEQ